MFPHPNHFHKAQSTKPNIEHVRHVIHVIHHIHVAINLNNQVETSMNLESSHSTHSILHTKNPNIIVKPQTGFK